MAFVLIGCGMLVAWSMLSVMGNERTRLQQQVHKRKALEAVLHESADAHADASHHSH